MLYTFQVNGMEKKYDKKWPGGLKRNTGHEQEVKEYSFKECTYCSSV